MAHECVAPIETCVNGPAANALADTAAQHTPATDSAIKILRIKRNPFLDRPSKAVETLVSPFWGHFTIPAHRRKLRKKCRAPPGTRHFSPSNVDSLVAVLIRLV